eukprot:UN07648
MEFRIIIYQYMGCLHENLSNWENAAYWLSRSAKVAELLMIEDCDT